MMLSAVWFGLTVLACCSLAGPVGRLLGVIDYPDGGRKSHARPTPMVGGIALTLPLMLVAAIESTMQLAHGDIFRSILMVGGGFLVLGWYDDRYHIQPAVRLFVSTALFGAVILAHPGLALETLDLGFLIPLGALAFPFTVLCLVGLQNAINMADGMNGLLTGLSIFWTACLLKYAPAHMDLYLTLMLLTTLATSLIWGVNTLFLLDAGLNNFEAFAANAFFTAGMMLFEVPTGVVADLKGR